jgi:hypothetical protein
MHKRHLSEMQNPPIKEASKGLMVEQTNQSDNKTISKLIIPQHSK